MLTLLGVSAAFGGALFALSELGGGSLRLSFRLLLSSFLAIYGFLKLLSRFRSPAAQKKVASVRRE